jgi:hypothetical protein
MNDDGLDLSNARILIIDHEPAGVGHLRFPAGR